MLAVATFVGVRALLVSGVMTPTPGSTGSAPGWFLVGSTLVVFGLIGLATIAIVPSLPTVRRRSPRRRR